MLRSRAKLGDTPRQLAGFRDFQGLGSRTNRGGKTRFSRRGMGFIVMTFFVFLSLYRIWRAVHKNSSDEAELVLIPYVANQDMTVIPRNIKGPTKNKSAEIHSDSTWRFPLVN